MLGRETLILCAGLWGLGCASQPPTLTAGGGNLSGQDDAGIADASGLDEEFEENEEEDEEEEREEDLPEGKCDQGLEVVVRDFTEEHPDFESYGGQLRGIVQKQLGMDKKPVYAPSGSTEVTTGKAEFDQWYRDVAGVNMRVPTTLSFTEESPGVFVYDNSAFFPADNLGFGNGPVEIIPILGIPLGTPKHNFLFTTEAHTKFTYKGGEKFTFRGDDDLWVFINDRLAVDLGGVHGAIMETVDLDMLKDELGIEEGETYPMDIFHAERHTNESNYRIETTIDLSCIENVVVL